jgi:uncharacterized protein
MDLHALGISVIIQPCFGGKCLFLLQNYNIIMAHTATRKISYWGQAGILVGLVIAGLVVAGIVQFIGMAGKINFSDLGKLDSKTLMDKLLVPENANLLRIMQFASTLIMMFLPAYFYAKICHKKPFVHLGMVKKPRVEQMVLVVLIMLACMPVIGALQEVIKFIPFSKETLATFQKAEDDYFKQILIIGRMNNFGEYILSIAMIALLPAIFEEVLFRGGMQNLLSRWTKMPILSICFTAAVFSLVHGSYIGFLPRFVLGFVLGWLFYRTDKLWLNILAHFVNNAVGVTAMYIMTKMGKPITPNTMEDGFPIMIGVAALAVVIGLLYAFDKVSKKDIDKPGLEVMLPGYINPNNPFEQDYNALGKNN